MDLDGLRDEMRAGFAGLRVELLTARTSLEREIASVKSTAEETRDQARATNGRVTKLEIWRSYIEGVKAGAGGLWQYAIAAVGVALVFVNLWIALN